MIKNYNSNESLKLSDHFSLSEFRCKCGGNHVIKVDSELVEKLEQLREKLNCSQIIVNSGYRCYIHDKNVGGSGTGMHTRGMAADIVCYDENGDIIPAGIVCCVAQDVGFRGIANIDLTYTAVHVDTRAGDKWYGDEAVPNGTNSSVCEDFYDYYKDVIEKSKPKTNGIPKD